MNKFSKVFFILFAILFFFTPLILWPFTSEVFEFNKMVFVYIMTTLIVGTWAIESIVEKRIIFSRTLLDIPLVLFLISQIASTIFSIDTLTSIFGFYSRFNGGLLSTICYLLLYWVFVSVFDAIKTRKLILILLASSVVVATIASFEHFGIYAVCAPINAYAHQSLFTNNCWVQDVKSRVFSTLGQTNWLAAWVVALLPIIFNFQFTIFNKFSIKKFSFSLLLSLLLFSTLLFTKSRSGLLGFAVADFIFWTLSLWKFKAKILKPFLIINFSLLILSLIIGTQYSPSISQYFSPQSIAHQLPASNPQIPALESGGTESGAIRKIVWTGAIEVFKHYPIFGTGVETFAYSYNMFRPSEHNLVSEWDFIYNKAHNEYLNFMANTGTFGIVSYLIFVGFSIYLMFKSSNFGLLAGFISLLVTNFFGFSVVVTQLQLFLYPAMAIALSKKNE